MAFFKESWHRTNEGPNGLPKIRREPNPPRHEKEPAAHGILKVFRARRDY